MRLLLAVLSAGCFATALMQPEIRIAASAGAATFYTLRELWKSLHP